MGRGGREGTITWTRRSLGWRGGRREAGAAPGLPASAAAGAGRVRSPWRPGGKAWAARSREGTAPLALSHSTDSGALPEARAQKRLSTRSQRILETSERSEFLTPVLQLWRSRVVRATSASFGAGDREVARNWNSEATYFAHKRRQSHYQTRELFSLRSPL